MSFAQSQLATALLIRLPDKNRDTLDGFLGGFELTDLERRQIKAVANHREVLKFGDKMRRGRVTYLWDGIPISQRFFNFRELIPLLLEEFDPHYTQVGRLELFSGFRHFFRFNAKVRKFLQQNAPAFIHDLIEFELIQAQLQFEGFLDYGELHARSLLSTTRIQLTELDYDLPTYTSQVRDLPEPDPDSIVPFEPNQFPKIEFEPEESKTNLLFTVDDSSEEGFRMFNIEREVYDFLLDQAGATPSSSPTLPAIYPDLVDLGVCRPH